MGKHEIIAAPTNYDPTEDFELGLATPREVLSEIITAIREHDAALDPSDSYYLAARFPIGAEELIANAVGDATRKHRISQWERHNAR